ncbi:MAG: hypothetical protein ACJ72G_01365 [Friedmanniella sp.]|jgi:hypothetical protein
MTGPIEVQSAPGLRASRSSCPAWCSTPHGVSLGEDDWLHVGEPLAIAHDARAQLCMSVDPVTGSQDGPYVLIGSVEYTLAEAQALGTALIALATTGSWSALQSGPVQ